MVGVKWGSFSPAAESRPNSMELSMLCHLVLAEQQWNMGGRHACVSERDLEVICGESPSHH